MTNARVTSGLWAQERASPEQEHHYEPKGTKRHGKWQRDCLVAACGGRQLSGVSWIAMGGSFSWSNQSSVPHRLALLTRLPGHAGPFIVYVRTLSHVTLSAHRVGVLCKLSYGALY